MQSVMQISLESVWYNTDPDTYMKKDNMVASRSGQCLRPTSVAMCLRAKAIIEFAMLLRAKVKKGCGMLDDLTTVRLQIQMTRCE